MNIKMEKQMDPSVKESSPSADALLRIGCIADIEKVINTLFSNNQQALFRGQSNAAWPLTPKIIRRKDGKTKRIISIKGEKKILEYFKQHAYGLNLRNTPKNDIEWLSLAQHHGLPTRLLDWSANPLVALYFAVETGNTKADGEEDVSTDSALFMVGKTHLPLANTATDVWSVDTVQRIKPFHISERITAQFAEFTLHPSGEDFSKHCTKMLIPGNKRRELRRLLNRFGFNSASMYPGLDGLCKHTDWASTDYY